ncbi:hypothetical protein KMZ68_03410 [Bradyrhizobium sediminis]|uniref:Uncharacterized protein n=1 Tax=Bradyrhizobium sediminis TaxID=2840469 RepID=A0A975RSG3_9BRAD|nr:hypothetical protein [Bradyrhizobium sediminis]QWG18942.1 hypothetical protein KMZ68_03410 [Bradyrhizobium sediminis]
MSDSIQAEEAEALVIPKALSVELDKVAFEEGGVRLYAEPVSTIILLLKAAAAIVGLIRAFSKDSAELNVIKPLEEIIRGVENILKELQALRDYIPVALDDAFRKRITISVATAMDEFTHALAGLSDDQIRRLDKNSAEYKAVEAIAGKQLSNAYDLRGYDFPGYFAVCTASLSYISMCIVLRSSKAKVKDFATKITNWLAFVIDPKNAGSAAAARDRMVNDANQARAVVDGYPRQVFLGYYTRSAMVFAGRDPGDRPGPGDRERRTVYYNWYATQAGSFDAGLQWSPQQQISDAENPRGWPLIPSEGNSNLHDGDESAYARCNNNLNGINGQGGLNPHVSRGKNLYSRAKELDAIIAGIKELSAKIARAADEFK